jgi:hypothetical protein
MQVPTDARATRYCSGGKKAAATFAVNAVWQLALALRMQFLCQQYLLRAKRQASVLQAESFTEPWKQAFSVSGF